MRVLICGGGVIGVSIARFLARRGVAVELVERSAVACAASGKSGGFLALDWCDGSPLGPLARRSFALHGELAELPGADWGWRRLGTLAVAASETRSFAGRGRGPAKGWIGPDAAVHGRLGSAATTAQIHPAAFTAAMMDAARAGGARLRLGTVEGLLTSRDGSAVRGARVDGRPVEADLTVIAMGPWSDLARRWLPLPAVYGLKGHSLIFDHAPPDPECLFAELETAAGEIETPEIYPRPDGTTYVCGLPEAAPLPRDPETVRPDPAGSRRLRALAARIVPALGRATLLAAQSCYRPVTRDGLPLIGRVPGVEGACIATGHSVWGMLNAPATGEAMAELICDGAARTVDLAAFDPARLPLSRPDAG